jgi:Cdc6-like AAA superfamily ATPase
VVGSIPIFIYNPTSPWVISAPICFGAFIVAGILLIAAREEIKELASEEDSGETEMSNTFSAALSIKNRVRLDEKNWPLKPEGFINPDPAFEANMTNIILQKQRLVLTGETGSGKTTCAVDICRKFEKLNGSSPLRKVPVFISLSQAPRRNGLATLIFDQVTSQLAIHQHSELSTEKKSVKDGSLLLVLDDLIYMTKEDENELQKFVNAHSQNAYMCIISKVPSSSFLARDFPVVEMQEWESKQFRNYIDQRITDSERKNNFIAILKRAHMFDRKMAPGEASFLVDSCLDGTFFELIKSRDMNSKDDYRIMDSYLRIMIAGSDSKLYRERIHEFGKLALKLLTEGRSIFNPADEKIDYNSLTSLMPKLFQQRGNSVTFKQVNYQVFLAGRYIADFWEEARKILEDASAGAVIWEPVYNCAVQFSTEAQILEIHSVFMRLSNNTVK